MKRSWIVSAAAVVAVAATPAAAAPSHVAAPSYADVVAAVLGEPYQSAYVPTGTDNAFPNNPPNTHPTQDYTSGSVPGNPDHPGWPPWFELIEHTSADGAPLISRLAVQKDANGTPLSRPGIVVVHGFNTRAKESVIRWAAMLYANGYHVLAVDQRDFNAEYLAGKGYPNWLQTFGWKESEDVLAGGQLLSAQQGVTSVGVVGFSLGAQDTVLAMARDPNGNVFDAGLTFSGPADQNAQIYSTADPPGCTPPACTYPATNALVTIVVPPYNQRDNKYQEGCQVLTDAATRYGTTIGGILAQEQAYKAQDQVSVPLLNLYTSDDPLVKPFHATMMGGYNTGRPLQRTYLIDAGSHAYYNDRWWQQRAVLRYFKGLLPGAFDNPAITVNATVQPTPGGTAMSQHSQLVTATRQAADALQAPLTCTGGPTAAVVTSFTAGAAAGRVLLRWRTAVETGLAGFNVYAGRARLNTRLIRAAGDARGHVYSVRAPSARRYVLELVKLDGSRSRVSTRPAPRTR